MPGHASLTLDGYRMHGVYITRPQANHFRRKGPQDCAKSVKRSSHLGHIIARFVEGDGKSPFLQVVPASDRRISDVYPRWIIIALGLLIVSLIVPFRISFAFYFMQQHQWYTLNTFSTSE